MNAVNSMILMPAKRGTCAMCATEHDEHQPHNYWSLFYGVRFKMKYGRDPTHADCLAHLSPEYRTRGYKPGQVKNMPELKADFVRMREEYKSLLAENKQAWNEPDGDPIPEPVAVSE